MSRAYCTYILIYFIILYIFGFISNYKWREAEDILYLNRQQWGALFLMWLPVFIGGFIK